MSHRFSRTPLAAGALLALAALAPLPLRAQDDGVPLGPGSRIVSRTIVEADSARGWTIAVRVPAIEGPAATEPGWAGFEARVDSIVAAEVADFRASHAEWVDPPDPEWISFLEADGSIVWVDPPLLSLVLEVSVYYAGAAHPGHYGTTLVWDAERGRALTLAELFRPGAAWLEALARETIPVLEAELGEMADPGWIAEGAGPDPANYARWALVEDGLLVLFDPYQVAPYAAGPQAVTVRRAALAEVADPAGPLGPR